MGLLPPFRQHRWRTARWALFGVVVVAGAVGVSTLRPDHAIRVATGSVSHTLCWEVFVASQDPGRAYAEVMRPEPGMAFIDWALRYDVDKERREVRTTVAGRFASRAVYRSSRRSLTARR